MNAASLAWIEDALRESLKQVPHGGAAVAALDGYRSFVATDQRSPDQPVCESTPFHICSCSKMFVAAAFSRLVVAGVERWAEQALRVIPGFRLSEKKIGRTYVWKRVWQH